MVFLGINSSATGKKWQGPSAAILDHAEQLAKIGNIDPFLATLYARRGANLENLENFQDPKLRNLMPNPLALKDCDQAANRILRAIQSCERIAIFGDYDVDGATSAALMTDYLRFYQIEPRIYIPDRLSEGYGPNTPAMEKLAKEHSLIICVDCGTLAFEPISAARKLGADVIVLDHHMGGETLPDAITVNPNRQDCENDLGYLSAAAVVFLVLVEVNRHQTGKTPNLLQGLDLVALSTVADVAPLIEANRAFVRSGLERIKLKERLGLRILTERFLKNRPMGAQDIGFVIGPRLNAGGRVGQSDLAVNLLLSQNEGEAEELVDELERLNTARRNIEAEITKEARAKIDASEPLDHLVYAAGKNWHTGVLGIVASRLKSAYNKPALAFGLIDDVYHGSARSVEGIDLGTSIARLVEEGLILKGGGHKMAAGLSLEPAQIEPAMQRLNALLARQAENLPEAQLEIDAVISPQRIDLDFVDAIEQAGPYGAMAPEPLFALADMKLTSKRILKEQHLKYQFQNMAGSKVDVLAFGARQTALEISDEYLYHPLHLAISLARNEWNGRQSVSIFLKDWAKA